MSNGNEFSYSVGSKGCVFYIYFMFAWMLLQTWVGSLIFTVERLSMILEMFMPLLLVIQDGSVQHASYK